MRHGATAADVAGYSRLMHNDEEATHACLTILLTDAVEPSIAQHGGRVVKNTGDGLLAEFRSAVEAVRAAAQFQERVHELTTGDAEDKRLAFRVGINIGDVIVEAHDIFGDGVNIAARLEGIAEPGGLVQGKTVDVKQLGRELNVRYVLEGSVQRSGNRMRVNVQLIDVETGNHLWAERFDKPVADLFDMQDEIVARLANQLGTELLASEARRAERAPHPNSMDLFQDMASANSGLTLENLSQARSLFERALSLDRGNIEALVGTAFVDAMSVTGLMTDERAVRLAAAEATLTRVLSLMPNHARAHRLFGVVQIFTKRATQGIAECEHALELDRNLAQAHGWIGLAKCFIGRAEETEAHVLEALRLSPRDNKTYNWMTMVGVAKSYLGDDDAAVGSFRRAIETNRNAVLPLVLSVVIAMSFPPTSETPLRRPDGLIVH